MQRFVPPVQIEHRGGTTVYCNSLCVPKSGLPDTDAVSSPAPTRSRYGHGKMAAPFFPPSLREGIIEQGFQYAPFSLLLSSAKAV